MSTLFTIGSVTPGELLEWVAAAPHLPDDDPLHDELLDRPAA
jgi:hypothetical protein